ncbi:MAG: hypothetical protein V1800_04795 [Candidatus Latescibacterota bacterium]
MSIAFNTGRWRKIKEDSTRWWAGDLKRPLIQMTLTGCDPGRPEPGLPYHSFAAFYDLSVSPDAIVDRWDYQLSCCRFMGDAFPCVWPNFGPGVLAAFLGARLETGESTCWFHPTKEREIDDIRFQVDPQNRWLQRIKELCRAAMVRWEGGVQVGMTDLGGNLDILSAFRPGEKLLLDLYDAPDAVKRLTWEAHERWWECFNEIHAILQPANPGYTAWAPIFSETPYYMLQCDFSYMIGPDMFDAFVRPELRASCKRLGHSFYHLDGPGQLAHLDSLLRIEELDGVQWVPGAGQPGWEAWPEIYRKIHDAGKLIQLWGDMETLDAVVAHIGTTEGVVLFSSADVSEKPKAIEFLEKYGAL